MWIEVIFIMAEFMLLYGIAFKFNKDCRSSKDFLFISPKQWEAIIVFMLLTIIAVLKM